jgi:hypothetical protein
MCDTLTMLIPIFKNVTQPKLVKPARLVVFLLRLAIAVTNQTYAESQ